MPVSPFSPNSPALLETAIAQRALTQLNLAAMYPRVCVRDYEEGAFQRGDEVTIRRPKRRIAQDLDPRIAPYTFTEAQFFAGNVKLERLWTDGFLIYGYDPSQTMQRYIDETGDQIADAIVTPNDEYMYSQSRTWDIPATGVVNLGDHPPVAISACVDLDGQLTAFNNEGLRGASVFLDLENVVPTTNRYCVISSTAKGAFLGDSVVVNGFAAASIGSGTLIQRGLQIGELVERYGFMVGGSNSVGGQTSSTSNQSISNIYFNTEFFYADKTTNTSVRAVNLDISSAAGVAIGQIARIGRDNKATAFGVVLRVINNTVTLVPYAPNGTKLTPGQISPGEDEFRIPIIPSVNTVNHMEGLAMATRTIAEPRPGSGAVAASIRDPGTNLSIQVFTGQYDLATVSERNAAYLLTGSKITDFRKCGLILSL